MSADNSGQPGEPELDEYGVPVQNRPKVTKSSSYLITAFSVAVAVAEVVTYIRYVSSLRPSSNPPWAGLREFGVIIAPVGLSLLYLVRLNHIRGGRAVWIIARLAVAVAVTTGFFLLVQCLFPHACDHGGCNS